MTPSREAVFAGSADPRALSVGKLRLIPITAEMLDAEQRADMTELRRLLRARITSEWPPLDWEPHVHVFILKQYEEWPETAGWHRYVLLEGLFGRLTLVGAVGGFPTEAGDVEIGYSTLPEFQRRGFASAFARALVEWLLNQDGVASVSAQTYPRLPESIKVMERSGMQFAGEGDEAGAVRYRRVR